MSMDLSRFHATFLAESREGLDVMESGLLALESGRADSDTIHAIFRAAHSIKGGAATFGFQAMAGFTHILETLLEELRSNRRPVDGETIAALLGAVDVLRGLLDAAESGGESDSAAVAAVGARLEAILKGGAAAAVAPTVVAAAGEKPLGWNVRFTPAPSMYLSGNDPLRILRELHELGPVQAECRLDRLPAFEALDPYEAWLAWDLRLDAPVTREAVAEAFVWVEDECELDITPVLPERAAAPAPSPAAEAVPAAQPPGTGTATAAGSPAASAGAPAAAAGAAGGGDSTLRVQTGKIDTLINLVGELVITQSMLRQVGAGLDPRAHQALMAGLAQLERNTRDLQEAVIGIRMLPVGSVFSRFPRMVRDLSARLGKQVRLRTLGEATELDKGVIEKIADPLVHLVRNSIDHGLESAGERVAAGKPAEGTLTLSASHQGGHIVIEVADDGRGLDRDKILAKARERGLGIPDNPTDAQVWELIFQPGFSTADQVTDLSGRGVGMDVVRKNILALGGEIAIDSRRGMGTTISVRLPLTLAILDGMVVAAGSETFILPLGYVIEAMQPAADDIKRVQGNGRVLRVRGDYLPLVNVAEFYRLPGGDERDQRLVVVVENDGRKLALEVDELLGQQQVVVKNLEANYRRVPGVSGATILGDGRVALIVDVGGVARALTTAHAA
ncbi:chemotaxis protein CheA [Rehaibacterium terrae]|jgi:two-component system chemotaxis sensor kinase CheA|uniref:Chemotaxis protein CheA n=1 Tax=Rehaibacterium terrae TaxID=1341696 RepID=A0A7W8DFQ7_9GAMM|nr:chemotaxis protein CheA [Rehaibacterium terrae]MBB5016620.1 two-component system chemotaxis sensor kinase CheA [Rehaibacterium terrae]